MNEDMKEFIDDETGRIENLEAFYSRLKDKESDISRQLDMLRAREREVEAYRKDIERDNKQKEKNLRRELNERENLMEEREKEFRSRQMEIERHYSDRFEEAEQLRENIQNELYEKEVQLKNLIIETEREKEKYREESRKSIESKSQKFVDSALQLLSRKETKFHKISRNWSVAGAFSIFCGIGFAIYAMFSSADLYHQASNSSLAFYFYSLFRGLVVVTLFGALSRYSFVLSNSFMHESLKSGERLHAIKFGEFYLDAYGADAEWDQLKEAFENWNISGVSAFSKKQEDARAELPESVINDIERRVKGVVSKLESKGD